MRIRKSGQREAQNSRSWQPAWSRNGDHFQNAPHIVMMLLSKKLLKSWEAAGKPASKRTRKKTLPRSQGGSALEYFWDNNLHVWEANPKLLDFRMPQSNIQGQTTSISSQRRWISSRPHTPYPKCSLHIRDKIVSPPLVPSSHFQQISSWRPSPPHRTRRAHYCCPRTESDFQSEDSATIRNPKKWEEGQKCEMRKNL